VEFVWGEVADRKGGCGMNMEIAVVHEAAADYKTATELADRVLVESVSWLDDETVVHQRAWLRASTDGIPLTWRQIKQSALDAGIDAIGFFDGKPAQPDARPARRAILYLRHAFPNLAGVVLIRDQDDQPDRREGLEQARQQEDGRLPVVVGLAVVERESWVISGFDPCDTAETSRLETERTRLGFDPRLQSHELTACKNDNATRSPKRVLRELSGDDRDREHRCWRETSLDVLRERGVENGLAAYLNEIRNRLARLIGHVAEG
jgi:hypothetical protein